MKQALRIAQKGVLLGLLLLMVLGFTVHAAETKTITGAKIVKSIISRNILSPSDDPKHVMSQTVREDIITSPDQDWNDLAAVSYEQADHLAGNGSHHGVITVRHANGDETYLRYAGTDAMSVASGSAWEVTSQGTIQISGGTGKYKEMKGMGTYSGKSSPKGSSVHWEIRVE